MSDCFAIYFGAIRSEKLRMHSCKIGQEMRIVIAVGYMVCVQLKTCFVKRDCSHWSEHMRCRPKATTSAYGKVKSSFRWS